MNTTTMKTITETIADLRGRRGTLAALINDRSGARLQIESASASATTAHGAAQTALGDALVRHAVGEAEHGEVDAARTAVVAAETALIAARKRDGEARELAAAEAGLTARVDALDAQLADLQQQQLEAHHAALIADLHRRIDDYLESAQTTIYRFVDCLALDDYLGRDLGKPQGVRTMETSQACFPGFAGHRASMPDFDTLMREARARLLAEHGAAL